MSEILISGNHPFKMDVPYKLVETGAKGEKPLIIYLHGYKQNLTYFKKKITPFLSLRAYHLLLQGPYPVYDEHQSRKVEDWGRAWYLYDGSQNQFMKSMEISSDFIQEIVDAILPQIRINRLSLFGYSMGGYLAGYFALSRPNYVNDLVVVGGRIKIECFADKSYPDLQVLALHGQQDEYVSAGPAQKSCRQLKAQGATVTFKILEEGHRLNKHYMGEARRWFLNNIINNKTSF